MTFAQLQALREGGFNRISMGVQSASDRELQTLGRRHSFVQAQESVRMAQAAGFRNVSVDLMLGTPGQTAQAIDRFVETFDALGVQHISGYLLKIEPAPPLRGSTSGGTARTRSAAPSSTCTPSSRWPATAFCSTRCPTLRGRALRAATT